MNFAVARESRASGVALVVDGELDVATVGRLRAAVDEVLRDAPPRLVVDLSAASFIDSTGAGELMRAAKRSGAAGIEMALVVPPDNWRIRRVIEFMQFGELLPVHDDGSAFPT